MGKVTRKRQFNAGRYIPAIRGAYRVGRTAYNMYKNYKSSNSRRSTEIQPLTGEKDVRVTYMKRRMPRRKKKQFVRSVRRYRSHLYRSLPARIFQYGFAAAQTAAVNCSQYFGCFAGLLGQNCYDTHLTQAFDSIGNSASTNKQAASHLRVDHMSLSVVLNANYLAAVDVDVYKVICIKDIPFTEWINGTEIQSMHVTKKNLMRQAHGMDIEVNDAGAGIVTNAQNAGTSSTTQVVGDTLWNCPPFLRYWKIVKQSKIHLPAGGTCQFQLRTSKNKLISKSDCVALAAKAYFTQGYIFNINGRWLEGEGFQTTSLSMETFVRYNIKNIPGQSPTLVYDAV